MNLKFRPKGHYPDCFIQSAAFALDMRYEVVRRKIILITKYLRKTRPPGIHRPARIRQEGVHLDAMKIFLEECGYEWVEMHEWHKFHSSYCWGEEYKDKQRLFSKGRYVVLIHHFNKLGEAVGGHCIGVKHGKVWDIIEESPSHLPSVECPLWGYFRKKR